MNPTQPLEFAAGLKKNLQAFLKLGEEIFALAKSENQALSGELTYELLEFCQQRKSLLPRLDSVLMELRSLRQFGQQTNRPGEASSEEVKMLFRAIQNLLMRVLLLDRENQQAMLRRGLTPASHLPAAAGQRPHYVARLYQQNSRI